MKKVISEETLRRKAMVGSASKRLQMTTDLDKSKINVITWEFFYNFSINLISLLNFLLLFFVNGLSFTFLSLFIFRPIFISYSKMY
mmetsp:Transcript_12159/g.18791  ORF Transcript_12159/g.18791 Transcript_12159/m.18791 type:complete len:86 (+) Transcript_12159:2848-3105(+)